MANGQMSLERKQKMENQVRLLLRLEVMVQCFSKGISQILDGH